jgi:hypothetical protein
MLGSSEAVSERHRSPTPIYVTIFGLFSIGFGALIIFAVFALASLNALVLTSPIWFFTPLSSIGFVLCGIGFLQEKLWAWIGAFLLYGLAFVASIVQAFFRVFVWGIFLEPIILIYLLVPSVRTYFLYPSLFLMTPGTETSLAEGSPSNPRVARAVAHVDSRETKVLTVVIMLAIASAVPAVAASVHAVSVTGVTLSIIYPANVTLPWFGGPSESVSGSLFAWGGGQMGFRFSLTNLGLFQTHSINSISVQTSGFALYAPSTPISLPDLVTVRLSMQIQAPDYDYYGPLIIEIQTS